MPPLLSTQAVRPKVKTSRESVLFAADFTNMLPAGATLTGSSPSLSVQPAGLTFATPIVNTATFNDDDGRLIAIGAAVQVRISGGAIRTGTSQGGGLINTFVLDAGASTVDGLYNGNTIEITSATGAGQINKVLATAGYVGASKVCTMVANWSIIPDNTSVFTISGAIYNFTVQCADSLGNTHELPCVLQVVDS